MHHHHNEVFSSSLYPIVSVLNRADYMTWWRSRGPAARQPLETWNTTCCEDTERFMQKSKLSTYRNSQCAPLTAQHGSCCFATNATRHSMTPKPVPERYWVIRRRVQPALPVMDCAVWRVVQPVVLSPCNPATPCERAMAIQGNG